MPQDEFWATVEEYAERLQAPYTAVLEHLSDPMIAIPSGAKAFGARRSSQIGLAASTDPRVRQVPILAKD